MSNELNFSQSLDRLKESFLWAAAQAGNTEDCESLLAIGADINWKHNDGDTPLLIACRRGHISTIETLLVHGADINITGYDSLTPLHICCLRGDYGILNILLNSNPNLLIKTKDGKTALQLAESKGHENIISRLLSFQSSSSSSTSSSSSITSGNRTNNNTRSRLNGDITNRPSRQSRPLPSIITSSTSSSSLIDSNSNSTQQIPSPNNSENITSTSSTSSISSTSTSSSIRQQNNNRQGSNKPINSTNLPPNTPPIPLRTISSNSSSNLTTNHQLPTTTSYQLMGQHILPNHDENSILLRRQLETEIKEKRVLENKIKRLEEEIIDLGTLNATMADQLNEMQSENDELTEQLSIYTGGTIDKCTTIKDCEILENKFKLILQNIETKKTQIRSKELETRNNEQRLCVVCQENDKSVVLFPCRHMCLCEECSSHDDLDICPLCRRPIIQRISVFS